MGTVERDTRKLFRKKGTCSQTYFHIFDREFGHIDEVRERASDPLAGGIMQCGHQCGLLMGSALAVGAESFRRQKDPGKATALAIHATRSVRASFQRSAGSVNCREITDTDFSKKLQFARFLVFRARACFSLADVWTDEAVRSAKEALSVDPKDIPEHAISCASELARKMGRSDEEIVTVAGLAGGLGLGGDACGALIAAVWLRSLDWCKENPGKTPYSNPYSKDVLFAFSDAAANKFMCREICGRSFATIEEHTEHMRNGGCEKLIEAISRS